MRAIFSRKWVKSGMIAGLFFLSTVTVLEESQIETCSFRIENLAYGEKVQFLKQLEGIKHLLENMLEDDAMRASRPDSPSYGNQTNPVPPPSSSINSVLLEQIRCIVCLIKSLLETMDSKLDNLTISCDLSVVCDLSTIESKVDDIIETVETIESKIDNLTISCDLSTIESKVDEVIEIVGTIESKVFAQNEEILTIDSKIDEVIWREITIESKIDNLTVVCDLSTIESKIDVIESEVDRIESKIGEPWDTLAFDLLPSNTQETNDATYSVIEWFKAIYYQVYNVP